MAYTTTNLLSNIKIKAMIPLTQDTFSEDDILSLATEELQAYILPAVMSVREEYYIFEEEIDIVSGTSNYRIPSRAIGSKLRDVVLVSGSSSTSLPRLTPEEAIGQDIKTPSFSLRSETMVIHPEPTSSTDKLRLTYFMRPSALVSTVKDATVIAIDESAKTLTVTSIPSGITSSTKIDLVSSSGGCVPLAANQTITDLTSNVFTFASLPNDIKIGDHICVAEQSSLISAPLEYRTLLEQAVVVKILEALGDTEGLKLAVAKQGQQEKQLLMLISPRVEGEPTVITTDIW